MHTRAISGNRAQLKVGSKIDHDAEFFTCAQTRIFLSQLVPWHLKQILHEKKPFRLKSCWCTKTRQATDSNMSGNGDGDDPKYDESCETKRIGQNNKEEAELAIPYLPNQGRLDYLSRV